MRENIQKSNMTSWPSFQPLCLTITQLRSCLISHLTRSCFLYSSPSVPSASFCITKQSMLWQYLSKYLYSEIIHRSSSPRKSWSQQGQQGHVACASPVHHGDKSPTRPEDLIPCHLYSCISETARQTHLQYFPMCICKTRLHFTLLHCLNFNTFGTNLIFLF